MKKLTKLISNKELKKRIKELADIIDKKYNSEPCVFVSVLKGSIFFYTELLKNIKNKNINMDFIQVKSYVGTNTTGNIQVVKDCSTDITGKNLIIVEDIIDTGITANFLYDYFLQRNPQDIMMCSLLQKPTKLEANLKLNTLVGFEIEDKFIVGYGLDLDEKFRNLQDIYIYNQ